MHHADVQGGAAAPQQQTRCRPSSRHDAGVRCCSRGRRAAGMREVAQERDLFLAPWLMISCCCWPWLPPATASACMSTPQRPAAPPRVARTAHRWLHLSTRRARHPRCARHAPRAACRGPARRCAHWQAPASWCGALNRPEWLCVRHTRVLFVLGCVLSKSLGLFRVISVKEPFFVGLISGEKNHSLNHDLLVNHGLEAKKS